MPVSRMSSQRWSRSESLMASSDSNVARLFGTDGVRGIAGHAPLDRPTVRRLGAALVRALPHDAANHSAPHLLVGRNTRESGVWIEEELAHGASGEGADV